MTVPKGMGMPGGSERKAAAMQCFELELDDNFANASVSATKQKRQGGTTRPAPLNMQQITGTSASAPSAGRIVVSASEPTLSLHAGQQTTSPLHSSKTSNGSPISHPSTQAFRQALMQQLNLNFRHDAGSSSLSDLGPQIDRRWQQATLRTGKGYPVKTASPTSPASPKAAQECAIANLIRESEHTEGQADQILKAMASLQLEKMVESPEASKRDRKDLCPSVAPTPRARSASVSKPMLYGSFMVRPAQILVPSANPANDFARVRNGGKPLQSRSYLSDSGHGLLNVASAPALLSGVGTSSGSDASPVSPKTPRSSRGMVRRVSKVACSVPFVNRFPVSPKAEKLKKGASSGTPSPSAAEPAKLKKSLSNKQVSFAEEGDASRLQLESEESPALKRSKKLLGSLHDLRRINVEDLTQNEETSGSFAADEKAAAMLHSTLGELFDSSASLRALETQLQDAQSSVDELGGKRFATALISARTMAVVQRKAKLIEEVEARIAEFETAHVKHDEIIDAILGEDYKGPPDGLLGIRRFIAHYIHKHPYGNPVEGDKSDFESFASIFKLPLKHHQLERMRSLSDEISQWWAEASLRIAEDGANYDQIHRAFSIAVGAGADSEHPYILRATKILNDRLADKVLKDAQERQQRDSEAFAQSEAPQVGPASRAADAIEKELLQVIAEGVPERDPRLVKVRDICKALREADGQRKRLAGRQRRLAGPAKS